MDLYHNPAYKWLIAIALAIVVWFAVTFIKKRLAVIIAGFFTSKIYNINFLIQSFIRETKSFFKFIFSLYAGSLLLELPANTSGFVDKVVLLVVLLQLGFWLQVIISFLIHKGFEDEEHDKKAISSTVSVMVFASKLVLWTIVLLLCLDNLGVNITALIGGLGIGGIAIALAVQNILGDLFASLTIILDKPFVVGDFIIVNEYLGTIENIGLKTTRIRSLGGEQLIFPNAELLQSKIRNYKRMYERRVVMNIGVVYETPYEKLKRIPSMIEQIIKEDKRVRFDRAHFSKFMDYSLDFEIVYWVLDPDYNIYMDIQQNINLEVYKTFSRENIQFAYPTQKVFLDK